MTDRNRSCCCGHSWCDKSFRSRHRFPFNFVCFTSEADSRLKLLSALRLDANSALPHTPRVWIGHFHEEDIQIQLPADDDMSDDMICVGIHSKTRLVLKGGSAKLLNKKPPIPNSTEHEILCSWFAIFPLASYTSYFRHSTNTYPCLKDLKRKISPSSSSSMPPLDDGNESFGSHTMSTAVVVSPEPMRKSRRGNSVGIKLPFHESCRSASLGMSNTLPHWLP